MEKNNYVNDNEQDLSKLFLTCDMAEKTSRETWYLDSSCSNHDRE